MDQRGSFGEFGSAKGIGREEGHRSATDTPDIRDLETDAAIASDGDGAMLGRVLIYASIVAVGVVAILCKRFL
jgi:hypothetical protein